MSGAHTRENIILLPIGVVNVFSATERQAEGRRLADVVDAKPREGGQFGVCDVGLAGLRRHIQQVHKGRYLDVELSTVLLEVGERLSSGSGNQI